MSENVFMGMMAKQAGYWNRDFHGRGAGEGGGADKKMNVPMMEPPNRKHSRQNRLF